MNENVWDPATVQQAPHPGFMPPCPQSLPKINLLLHRFLTTFYPKTWGKKKKTLHRPGTGARYPSFLHRPSCTQTLRTHITSKVPSFLIHPHQSEVGEGQGEVGSSQLDPSFHLLVGVNLWTTVPCWVI